MTGPSSRLVAVAQSNGKLAKGPVRDSLSEMLLEKMIDLAHAKKQIERQWTKITTAQQRLTAEKMKETPRGFFLFVLLEFNFRAGVGHCRRPMYEL